MQNKAFLKIDDDASASTIQLTKSLKFMKNARKLPINEYLRDFQSQKKYIFVRLIRSNQRRYCRNNRVKTKKKKKTAAKTRKHYVTLEVFQKLYEDASVRKTRHQIAKGLSESTSTKYKIKMFIPTEII